MNLHLLSFKVALSACMSFSYRCSDFIEAFSKEPEAPSPYPRNPVLAANEPCLQSMLARTELTRPNARAIAKIACATVLMAIPPTHDGKFIAGG